MRIVMLTQYFPPEDGAAVTRAKLIAFGLAQMGHQVTVVAPFPNYPQHQKKAGDRYRLRRWERMGPIRILRTYVYTSKRLNFFTRSLGYLSYTLSSLMAVSTVRKSDAVLAITAPIFVGISGSLLASLCHKPFLLEVQDLWPDGLISAGVVPPKGFLARTLRRSERSLYRKAVAISALTEGLAGKIEERGGKGKVFYIPNAYVQEFAEQAAHPKELRTEFGWQGKFVVLYAGTIGFMHDVESLLYAAERLQEDKRILIVIAGEGQFLPNLRRIAAEKGLRNVQILGHIPMERVPDLIGNCDLAVSCLKSVPINEMTVPGKLLDYWLCGKPILYLGSGEGGRLVERLGSGIVLPAENTTAIAEAIGELSRSPARCQEMGQRGRQYALAERSPSHIIDLYTKMLTPVAKP